MGSLFYSLLLICSSITSFQFLYFLSSFTSPLLPYSLLLPSSPLVYFSFTPFLRFSFTLLLLTPDPLPLYGHPFYSFSFAPFLLTSNSFTFYPPLLLCSLTLYSILLFYSPFMNTPFYYPFLFPLSFFTDFQFLYFLSSRTPLLPYSLLPTPFLLPLHGHSILLILFFFRGGCFITTSATPLLLSLPYSFTTLRPTPPSLFLHEHSLLLPPFLNFFF